MATHIIGYTASGVTIVAYGLQFLHTVQCGTIEGISLPRTLLDTASLSIWVFYATRTEDIPLLIATSCELFLSFCICFLVIKHAYTKKSCIKPPAILDTEAPHIVIPISSRRNSI
jgi:uncharacterized protein with PQ loop repeat